MQTTQTQLFMEKLYRFNQLIHHQISDIAECPHSEYKMLGVIYGELERQKKKQVTLPGVPISILSKALLHSKPATSRVLKTLEEKEYIIRIPSRTDRRTVYVTLTEKGQEKNIEMKDQVDEYMTQILSGLGKEDTRELLRLMDRLYDVVEHMTKTEVKDKKAKD